MAARTLEGIPDTGPDTYTHDVVVIGAGFTGIRTAVELTRRDPTLNVAVLEAGPRVGGRARSVASGIGDVAVDMGAHYFARGHRRLLALAQELAPEQIYHRRSLYGGHVAFRSYLDGEWVVTTRDNSFFELQGLSKDVPWSEAIVVLRSIFLNVALEKMVNTRAPWRTPWARKLDSLTLSDFLDAQRLPERVRQMWGLGALAVQSLKPRDISLLYYLWYHATSGGLLFTANDWEGGPQELSLRCGLGGLAERYAQELGDSLQLDTPVQAIDHGRPDRVLVRTARGETLVARRVVVAVSPHAVERHIEFTPTLHPARRLLHSQRQGHACKLVCFYDEPWWRDSGGHCFYGYVGAYLGGSIEWILDTSVPGDGPFSLMCFVSEEMAAALASDAHEARQRITEELVRVTGDRRATEVSSFHLCDWKAEPFIGGGPNTGMAPNVLSRLAEVFNRPEGPHGRLYFTSSEYATEFSGYVEGALAAGELVSGQVHHDLLREREGTAAHPRSAHGRPGLAARVRTAAGRALATVAQARGVTGGSAS